MDCCSLLRKCLEEVYHNPVTGESNKVIIQKYLRKLKEDDKKPTHRTDK